MFKKKAKVIASFVGNKIDYNQVNEILTTVWSTLEGNNLELAELKLVYSVVTEMVENAYRYSYTAEECKDCIFCLVTDNGKKEYQITIKNPIEITKSERLKDKIDFVNSLSPIGLKKFYQHEIVKQKDENHAGAGLGLIIIARKINKPIELEIQKYNNKIAIVTLKATMKL